MAIAMVIGTLGAGLAACAAAIPSVAPSGSSPATPSPAPSPAVTTPAVGGHDEFRYVALGDSFTIGTSVSTAERWPDQLVARLAGSATSLQLVANLGVDGFTSRDVIEVELPVVAGLDPGFATLLIGVNDVVQGVPAETFRINTTRILESLLALLPAERIVAVAIPDYTVTPQGAAYGDPTTQSVAIRRNNDIVRTLAEARGIRYVDIYPLSLAARTDRTLVAVDGLHPSGIQYAAWVDRIAPVVTELLGR